MRHGVPHERHDGEVAPASSEIVAKGVEELFNHDETGGGDVVGDEVRASRAGVDGGEDGRPNLGLEASASLGTGASKIVHLDVGWDVVEDALGAAATVADVRDDAGDALEVSQILLERRPARVLEVVEPRHGATIRLVTLLGRAGVLRDALGDDGGTSKATMGLSRGKRERGRGGTSGSARASRGVTPKEKNGRMGDEWEQRAEGGRTSMSAARVTKTTATGVASATPRIHHRRARGGGARSRGSTS